MGTPTKPKKPVRHSGTLVKLNQNDRQEILEAAGFEIHPCDSEQKLFIEEVEEIITKQRGCILEFRDPSMPAHTRVELEEIFHLAKSLSEKLSPDNLTHPAKGYLNKYLYDKGLISSPRPGFQKLSMQLALISEAAQAGVNSIVAKKLKSDGGAKKKKVKFSINLSTGTFKEKLKNLFKSAPYYTDNLLRDERHREYKTLDELEGYFQDFMEACCKHFA